MRVTVEGFEPPVSVSLSPAGTAFWAPTGQLAVRVDVRGRQIAEEQLLVFRGEAGLELRPASSMSEPEWPVDASMKIGEPEFSGYPIAEAVKDGYLILDADNVPWVRLKDGPDFIIISLGSFTNGTPAMPVRIFKSWTVQIYAAGDSFAYAMGDPDTPFE